MMTRQEQIEAEKIRGAFITKRNMARGLVHLIAKELDPRHSYKLLSDREYESWEVSVMFSGVETPHVEPFKGFPSDELRTKIMLLK